MKKLWKNLSGSRPLFLLTLLVALAFSLNSVLLPTVSGNLVTQVMAASGLSFRLFGAFLAVSCAQLALSMANQYTTRRLVLRQKQALRRRAFEGFSRMRRYGQEDRASLASFLNNDVVTLAEQYFLGAVDIATCVSLIAFSAVSLVAVHWLLAAVIIGISTLIIVVPGLLRKRSGSARERCSRQMARYNSVLQSFLGGLPVVRAYCCRDRAASVMEEENRAVAGAEAGMLRWGLTIQGSSAFLQVLKDVLILSAGVVLVYRGTIQIGELVAVLQLTAIIAAPIELLAYLLHKWNEALPLLDKLEELAPERAEEEGLMPLNGPFSSLTAQRVSYRVGDTQILTDVSASFQAGKKYLITGESGSGKSTFLRLLAQLEDLDDTGEVRLNRREAGSIPPADYYRMICPVFQEPYLFHATLRENILLGREMPEAAYRALIEKLNLGYLLERFGGQEMTPEAIERLSGGERQRVALARAMAREPAVYLLDEVTSALDPANSALVEGLLLETKAAVIHVCHKPNEALLSRYDEHFVMSGGRLTAVKAG